MSHLIDINDRLRVKASAEHDAKRHRNIASAVGLTVAVALGVPAASNAYHNKLIADQRIERQEIVASGVIHAGAGITFGKGREVYKLSALHDPQKDHQPIGTLRNPAAITNFIQARGYDGKEYILTDPNSHEGETVEEFSANAVAIPFQDFDSMSRDPQNLSFIGDSSSTLPKDTDNKVSFEMIMSK